MQRLSLFAFFFLFFAVCALAADRDTSPLMQADRDFAQATAGKGVDGWMAYMAPGAVLLGTDPKATPDKIKETMTGELEDGGHLTWEPTKAGFISTGLGYTIGRFEFSGTDNHGKPMSFKASYMTTWQLQKDGSWKVIGDIGEPDK